MNKVLIISYSYPPSQAPAAQRPFYLAKYLNKEKWETFVVTPKVSDSSMGHALEIEELENVQINFTKNINISGLRGLKSSEKKIKSNNKKRILLPFIKQKIYSFMSAMTIPDKGVFWIPFAVKKSFSLIKTNKIDVIFTTSPLFSNHLAGLFLKKLLKVSWVADFRDFHYVENYKNTKLIRRYVDKWLEKMVIHNADKVLFIAESMRVEYCQHYKELEHKSFAVYNGFEPELKLDVLPIPVGQPLTIFYAGSFYAGERSPFPLLEMLDTMIEEGKISEHEIKIKIAGNIEQVLIEEMSKYKVSKSLEFLGLISRAEVLNEIRSAHLLWLIVGNTKKHYMGFPIKGYEYIAAQRNILAFVPKGSESDNIISDYKLGYIINNNNIKEDSKHKEIFYKIVQDYKELRLNNPLDFDDNLLSLTKELQSKKIEEIFSTLIS